MFLKNFVLLWNGHTKIKRLFICSASNHHWLKLLPRSVYLIPFNFVHTSTSLPEGGRTQLEDLPVIKYCKENGFPLPENFTEAQQTCLENQNFHQQLKYIHYLVVTEFKKKNDKVKLEVKKERKKILKEGKQDFKNINYGLWKNSLFVKAGRQVIVNFHHHRLVSAALHNQSIVLDLSFDQSMNRKEKMSLANQIKWCVVYNREQRNPFNLTLCNVQHDSETLVQLQKMIPSIFKKNVPITISSESYVDLYGKEELVYLTPNAQEEMTSIDCDATYILGGIVDCGAKRPLTHTKAFEEGIKTQKLPLDR